MKTHNGKSTVCSQPSWRLASREVEAFVTEMGGHVGPVTFDRRGQKIQPFSVAPWAEEEFSPPLNPVINVLRGDFFCLPFGGNTTPFRGEQHPLHGETANGRWHFESLITQSRRTCLHLSLKPNIRPGRVDKKLFLVEGHNVIYSQHLISGMSGPMSMGHHAMLKFPDRPESGLISTSRFVYGQVSPRPLELPEHQGYSILRTGAEFDSLEAVPVLTGGVAELSSYPARRGFEDLVILVSDMDVPFAWTAVAFPKERFVWFALKNPRILRETILWISNGGRYYRPWNGRHINVMGLEEVTSYFHFGLAESARRNSLSAKGFPTCLQLNPCQPLAVPYIMGVVKVPLGFGRVISIYPAGQNQTIILQSANGKRVKTVIDLNFLRLDPG